MERIGDFDADQIEFGHLGPIPYVRTDGIGDPNARLIFRVGMADEPLERRGVTHLLEHLVLNRFRDTHLQFNGSTGATLTEFYCIGRASTTGPFLSQVISALAGSFEPGPVEHEANVLRAEAATKEQTPFDGLLRQRFGLMSYARPTLTEYWLERAHPDDLRAWAERFFTAGNCVLVVEGPELPDIDVAPLPVADPEPAPSVEAGRLGTGWYDRRPGPVLGLAGVERSTAAALAAGYLHLQLIDNLRHDGGHAYAPFTEYDPVSADQAMVVFGSDTGGDDQTVAATGVLDTLDQLIDEGPPAAVIERFRQRVDAAAETNQLRRATFEGAARDLVFGCDTLLATDEWRRRQVDATDEDIVEALTRIRSDALYSMPPQVDVERQHVRPAPPLADRSYGGQVHRPEEYSDIIEIGRRGGLTWRDGLSVTSIWSDTAQAIHTYDDGTWVLLDDRGAGIVVRPTVWPSSDEIWRAAIALVPPERQFRVGCRFDLPIFPPSRADLRVFDTAMAQADERWDGSQPTNRLYVRGGIVLSWLADRELLAGWVERAGRDHLAAYRQGRIGAADLYERFDGVLASDMVLPSVNDDLAKLYAESRKPRIRQVWDSVAGADGPWFADTPELVEQAHELIDKVVFGRRLGRSKAPAVTRRPEARVASGGGVSTG